MCIESKQSLIDLSCKWTVPWFCLYFFFFFFYFNSRALLLPRAARTHHTHTHVGLPHGDFLIRLLIHQERNSRDSLAASEKFLRAVIDCPVARDTCYTHYTYYTPLHFAVCCATEMLQTCCYSVKLDSKSSRI